jgi:glycogen synthase
MKILALSNLYPPHHGGTSNHRCQSVVESMRLRGHQVLVLTSMHGLKNEQRDSLLERRFRLNGAFGDPLVTKYADMKALELHNHRVLSETIQQFQPDVIQVFSLQGLSKSLIFTLRNSKFPIVYDVSDFWISEDIRQDPWLRFWNSPSIGMMESSMRKTLELSGERGRLDTDAPTRLMKGYERLPSVFGSPKDLSLVEPNSIPAFRFDRLFFCSHTLKEITVRAGFRVDHGDVIYPGIKTELFVGDVKPQNARCEKFLIATQLNEESGVKTALQALEQTRAAGMNAKLAVYGRGDSAYIAELKSHVIRAQLPVEFLNVSNLSNDLPKIYRHYDAFIYTAEWSEPFSTELLSAMAAGLPVIGVQNGGAAELLKQGENAFTYTSGDAHELATRIYEMQMAPALRFSMAETAQQEVLGKFNDSTVTDQIENYLQVTQEIWAHTAT